jgi:hypothetical protein
MQIFSDIDNLHMKGKSINKYSYLFAEHDGCLKKRIYNSFTDILVIILITRCFMQMTLTCHRNDGLKFYTIEYFCMKYLL